MIFDAKPCCHFLRDQPSGESREFFFLFWYPNRCIVFFSNGRISLTRIKQFVEIWWWPYLFNDTSDLHHILCSLILEPKQDTWSLRARRLCTRNRSKVLLYFFVHSNITIIHDIMWKTALLKKIKKISFQGEKKNHSTLLYDSNNANDKTNSPPRFTIERAAHLHNSWLLQVLVDILCHTFERSADMQPEKMIYFCNKYDIFKIVFKLNNYITRQYINKMSAKQ